MSTTWAISWLHQKREREKKEDRKGVEKLEEGWIEENDEEENGDDDDEIEED